MKLIRFRSLFRHLLLAGLFVLAGCYTVPETGRRSLSLVSSDQMASMAIQQFEAMKEQTPVSTNRAYNAQLQRVGARIRESVGYDSPDAQWEFVVFEDDALNAFAMPGGKVGVNTGMMDFVRSDDELAVVIGHEIAHVMARHASERYSQALGASAIGAGLGLAVKDQDPEVRSAVMAAYGIGAQVGLMLPYSRLHESEADYIGLLYSARAGYDPRVAIDFWQRMAEEGGERPPEFLSTHPDPANRIDRLREIMPEAMAEYRRVTGQ